MTAKEWDSFVQWIAQTYPNETGSGPAYDGNLYFSSKNLDACRVRLPRDLAEFVKKAGLDPVTYALDTIAHIKAGRLPKKWLDEGYNRGRRAKPMRRRQRNERKEPDQ